MKPHLFTAILALTALALPACSNDETLETDTSRNEIHFDIVSDNISRGTSYGPTALYEYMNDNPTAGFTDFRLYSTMADGTTYYDWIKYDTTSGYNLYWPAESSSSTLSFYAIHGVDNATFGNPNSNKITISEVTIPENADEQGDISWAVAQNVARGNTVNLKFSHLCTGLRFQIMVDNQCSLFVIVKKITVKNIINKNKAGFTLDFSSDDNITCSWGETSTDNDYQLATDENGCAILYTTSSGGGQQQSYIEASETNQYGYFAGTSSNCYFPGAVVTSPLNYMYLLPKDQNNQAQKLWYRRKGDKINDDGYLIHGDTDGGAVGPYIELECMVYDLAAYFEQDDINYTYESKSESLTAKTFEDLPDNQWTNLFTSRLGKNPVGYENTGYESDGYTNGIQFAKAHNLPLLYEKDGSFKKIIIQFPEATDTDTGTKIAWEAGKIYNYIIHFSRYTNTNLGFDPDNIENPALQFREMTFSVNATAMGEGDTFLINQ